MALSPLNQRRWRNFTANRRAYWSLWIFLVLYGISLFAELIAHKTVQNDGVERWNAIHSKETKEHHARYPEEQDVIACNQNAGWIELLYICALIRPT